MECCGRGEHNFVSSFENYKWLKKRVAGPIPDVEKYFLKDCQLIALGRSEVPCANTHTQKRMRARS
jgi:hypothetical protein